MSSLKNQLNQCKQTVIIPKGTVRKDKTAIIEIPLEYQEEPIVVVRPKRAPPLYPGGRYADHSSVGLINSTFRKNSTEKTYLNRNNLGKLKSQEMHSCLDESDASSQDSSTFGEDLDESSPCCPYICSRDNLSKINTSSRSYKKITRTTITKTPDDLNSSNHPNGANTICMPKVPSSGLSPSCYLNSKKSNSSTLYNFEYLAPTRVTCATSNSSLSIKTSGLSRSVPNSSPRSNGAETENSLSLKRSNQRNNSSCCIGCPSSSLNLDAIKSKACERKNSAPPSMHNKYCTLDYPNLDFIKNKSRQCRYSTFESNRSASENSLGSCSSSKLKYTTINYPSTDTRQVNSTTTDNFGSNLSRSNEMQNDCSLECPSRHSRNLNNSSTDLNLPRPRQINCKVESKKIRSNLKNSNIPLQCSSRDSICLKSVATSNSSMESDQINSRFTSNCTKKVSFGLLPSGCTNKSVNSTTNIQQFCTPVEENQNICMPNSGSNHRGIEENENDDFTDCLQQQLLFETEAQEQQQLQNDLKEYQEARRKLVASLAKKKGCTETKQDKRYGY